MEAIKMHGTTSADGTATIDVPTDGTIVGILGKIRSMSSATGTGYKMELSFASSNGFDNNDTRSSFFGLESVLQAGAAGASPADREVYAGGLAIKVSAGERLHMHIADIGSPSPDVVAATAWLYLVPARGGRASARRT